MKQIIKYIVCLGVFINLLTSCETHRLDGMIDDKVYLLDPGFKQLDMYNFGSVTYKYVLYKSGVGSSDANIELVADETTLEEYNQANNKSYKLLPSDMYSFPANCLIDKGSERLIVEVTFDTQKIMDLQGKKRSIYALPIKVVSNNGIEVDAEKNVLLLAPTVNQPCLVFDLPGLQMPSTEISDKGDEETFNIKVKTNYDNTEGLTFSVETDPTMMDLYTGFAQLAPEGSYELEANEFTIPAEKNELSFSVKLKKSALVSNQLCGTFVIPIRIKNVSQYFLDEDESAKFIKFTLLPDELSRTNWKVIDWNSCIDMDEAGQKYGRTPDKMLDGDATTFWGAKWFAPYTPMPYYFIFDMKNEHKISRLSIVKPEGAGNEWRGLEKAGYFEYSMDNVNWKKLADWTMTENATRTHIYDVPLVKTRYIRLTITEAFEYGGGVGNSPKDGALMDIAEFKAWGY